MSKRSAGFAPVVVLLTALSVVSVGATTDRPGAARFLKMSSQAEFLSGTLEGIAVNPEGMLGLANRAEKLAELEEPFVFTIAEHGEGWVVGTGNDGNVFLVRRNGETRALFSTAEPEVFAVWADADGTVFAGTSPDGKVYRWKGEEPEVFFDPEETYIWDIQRSADGSLLVATGAEGRLYKLDNTGSAELLYDTQDTHLKAVKPLPDGALLLGTAGQGLILRLAADGTARTLYDSPYPEVVAVATASDGVSYAAILASEASLVDLSSQASKSKQQSTKKEEGSGAKGTTAAVAVAVAVSKDAGYIGSRPSGFSGPRSVLLRIAPGGATETLWRFSEDTVYSLLWRGGRLWIGTGLDGKLFSFRDGKMVLEKDVDERQIVDLTPGESGPAFATTNGAAVFRVSEEKETRGRYLSPAQDSGQVSDFGTLMWRGASQAKSSVSFSARSGMSAEPDRTWSSWSEARSGTEVSLADVPAGRYVQWRADLEASNGESPVLSEVVVSYVQKNLPPRIERFTVMPPGEISVPAGFNAGNQVFEPAHPDRSGIFTTLEPATNEKSGRKTLWKKGYRTLGWEATDPNDDELTYSLFFRRQATPAADREWMLVRQDLDETSFSFDSTVLPDGEYRFLLRSADRKPGSGSAALTAEMTSETVVIDHTPPSLVAVERRGEKMVVKMSDRLSPLAAAEISIDAKEWIDAPAADGMLDARNETIEIDPSSTEGLLLLRITDSAFNSTTYDLLEESR
ncbi:MAG: WD40 repeat domain-containing protein [Acidobacteriota bacterium]|nr:WD40 repeat domain-containing protein [Acidobacteriota bacterium]